MRLRSSSSTSGAARARHVIQEPPQERGVDVGGDTQPPRQALLDERLDQRIRDDQRHRIKDIGSRTSDGVGQGVDQRLQPICAAKPNHAGSRSSELPRTIRRWPRSQSYSSKTITTCVRHWARHCAIAGTTSRPQPMARTRSRCCVPACVRGSSFGPDDATDERRRVSNGAAGGPRAVAFPVVLLSADARMEEKAQGLKVDGAIRKPIDLDQLFNTIDRIEHCSRSVKPAHESAQEGAACGRGRETSAGGPIIGDSQPSRGWSSTIVSVRQNWRMASGPCRKPRPLDFTPPSGASTQK